MSAGSHRPEHQEDRSAAHQKGRKYSLFSSTGRLAHMAQTMASTCHKTIKPHPLRLIVNKKQTPPKMMGFVSNLMGRPIGRPILLLQGDYMPRTIGMVGVLAPP